MELNPEDQQNLMGLRLETPGKWLSVLQPTACVRQPSNFVNGDRNHATTAIQGLWMMDVAGQNQRPADPERVVYHRFELEKSFIGIQHAASVVVDRKGALGYLNRSVNPMTWL